MSKFLVNLVVTYELKRKNKDGPTSDFGVPKNCNYVGSNVIYLKFYCHLSKRTEWRRSQNKGKKATSAFISTERNASYSELVHLNSPDYSEVS